METAPFIPSSPPRRPRGRRLSISFLILSWLACVIAWVLIIAIHVESVMATGPIIAGLGLLTGIIGLVRRQIGVAIVGAAHLGIALLFFALVNVLSWSPADADQPFTWMGLAYVMAITPISYLVGRMLPPAYEPWQCQACGYALIGLTDPRCPECGAGFDPATIAELQASPSMPTLSR